MSEADAAEEVPVEFDATGLVPVVTQDADSDEVLMVAYANAAAISRTTETGLAHYYSRSREELWQKGATSGNVQRIEGIRIDCDGDTLLYRVSQAGGACHTGHESCFYRSVEDVSRGTANENGKAETVVETEAVADRVFDPEAVYDD